MLSENLRSQSAFMMDIHSRAYRLLKLSEKSLTISNMPSLDLSSEEFSPMFKDVLFNETDELNISLTPFDDLTNHDVQLQKEYLQVIWVSCQIFCTYRPQL